MSDWLENVKAGDTVILSTGHYNKWIKKVERVTKTQVIIKDSNARYRRSTGDKVGARQWEFSSIKEGTKEAVDKILNDNKRHELINGIEDIKLKEVSTSILESIFKQLTSTIGDKE